MIIISVKFLQKAGIKRLITMCYCRIKRRYLCEKIIILTITVGSIILNSCKKDSEAPTPDYTNFKITSVKITAMPFLDGNSTSWDYTGGPDVFFNMEDVNNNVLLNGSSSRFSDISPSDLPLTWNLVSAYQITNISVTHYVTVYDFDTPDPNDLIGYVGFNMEDHKNGYPATISGTNGQLSVTITGNWY